jgi:hypothetical protein
VNRGPGVVSSAEHRRYIALHIRGSQAGGLDMPNWRLENERVYVLKTPIASNMCSLMHYGSELQWDRSCLRCCVNSAASFAGVALSGSRYADKYGSKKSEWYVIVLSLLAV